MALTHKVIRNLTVLPAREIPPSTPHFAVAYTDEREIFANMMAVAAGHSATQGLYYATYLPGQKLETTGFHGLMLTKHISHDERTDVAVGASRYGRLIEALNQITTDTEGLNSSNPLLAYFKTLKHSDLINPRKLNSSDFYTGVIPDTLLALIHENKAGVIQHPVGELILKCFSSYVNEAQIMSSKHASTDAATAEKHYKKHQGFVIQAKKFGAYSAGGKGVDVGFKIDPKVFLTTPSIAPKEIPASLDSSPIGFAKTMVAADALLNLDTICGKLTALGEGLNSVTPKEKIKSVNSIMTTMSIHLLQPYLMYSQMMYDLLTHPVVVKYLSVRLPLLYDSDLLKDWAVDLAKVKFSPIYAEIIRHFRTTTVESTIGTSAMVTIPVGLLDLLPFLQNPATVNATGTKASTNAAILKSISSLGLASVGGSMLNQIGTLGTSANSIIEVIVEMRTTMALYLFNSTETEDEVRTIFNDLHYVTLSSRGQINHKDFNVIITDGLLSSDKLDYDAVIESMIVPKSDLLDSSPNKKAIFPSEDDIDVASQEASLYHEFASKIVGYGNGTIVVKDTYLESKVVPLMIRLHPWFAKYAVNATTILGGKLAMCRYALDMDAVLQQHSNFSNFAAELSMDPHIMAHLIKEGASESHLLGTEALCLLKEFFIEKVEATKTTAASKGMDIPDAKDFGMEAFQFAFNLYFTSSRAINYHKYSEVLINSFLTNTQIIHTTDFHKAGAFRIPIVRPAYVDKAFQSTMFSTAGAAGQACEDLIKRIIR